MLLANNQPSVCRGNLVRIARRARALGIVLICALQKPTTDAIDSALRNKLPDMSQGRYTGISSVNAG